MKAKNIKPAIVLTTICLVVALLLALVNMLTAPLIKAANDAAANEALLVVLPDGKNFEKIELTDAYPAAVEEAYRADGGFVFKMNVTGYKSGLVIMCGIDTDGKVVGVKHIQTNETYGLENELNGAYIGDTLDSIELVIASSATPKSLTSQAYHEAVKSALQAYVIANGGSVDTRTPEQILQDNCNAALGTEGVVFTKWFATEIIEGIDAVYTASDNSGRVYVIGESFIGVKTDGSVVNLGEADETVIKTADTAINESVLTEITEFPEGIGTRTVKKIFVTNTGNYVFELDAKGYQALAGYGNGESIKIKLSISADGKIIDCFTVSHSESKGFGDVCATEEYYDEYRGASASDIVISVTAPDDHQDQISDDNTDIGAISSATFTTSGYQKAVKAAFDAYEILTGGKA